MSEQGKSSETQLSLKEEVNDINQIDSFSKGDLDETKIHRVSPSKDAGKTGTEFWIPKSVAQKMTEWGIFKEGILVPSY